jgi:hypothetical protein
MLRKASPKTASPMVTTIPITKARVNLSALRRLRRGGEVE